MKVVADSHIPYVQEYFSVYGELILKPGRTISAEDVRDADMLLVRSITPVNAALLKNSTVKFVGSITAGADHLDTTWLDEAGMMWSVAAGFNALPVADYVVSVIAALQKQQLLLNKKIKAAVIGVGNVGRLVADRLSLFNWDVVLCDPLRAQHDVAFPHVSLDDLSDVDFITLHVPLTKSGEFPTYHFINKDFLQRQKAGCVLLNASRGAVIHSDDLLQYGTHLHWCFDVWEHEPHINKRILEQVLCATPHIAGYSVQSKVRGIDMIYQIACNQKIIEPQPISPVGMKKQQLTFDGRMVSWQDVVLSVFDPLIMTEEMRTRLLPAQEQGSHFDEMRNQFKYRYEFEYTKVHNIKISAEARGLLEKLGMVM